VPYAMTTANGYWALSSHTLLTTTTPACPPR
jgi:hypothetical protein